MDDRELRAEIARALWDHDNAEMAEDWREMAWNDMGGSEPSDERAEYEIRADAVMAVLRRDRAGRPERVRQWAAETFPSGTPLDQDRRMVAAETEAVRAGGTAAARKQSRWWWDVNLSPLSSAPVEDLGQRMAEWARTHLAAQEPTDAEVDAVAASILWETSGRHWEDITDGERREYREYAR